MRPPVYKYRGRQLRRGTALIVTVFFLALITLMVMAFFESATFDRTSAGGHLDRTRAGFFAREGMERVVATLRRETVDAPRLPTETEAEFTRRKRNWILQPGALIVPEAPPADQKLLMKVVELSSGAPGKSTYTDPIYEPSDLNAPMIAEKNGSTRLITDRIDPTTGLPVALKLKWIYVRQDAGTGEQTLDAADEPSSTSPPIVGRFAYWADDESSKINYNLAWKRNVPGSASSFLNRNAESHPSRINLMALSRPDGTTLSEPMADELHQGTVSAPGRYYNTHADARQLEPKVPGISDMLAYNKFELTHYNHDPDTTFFGEERILLTTNRDLVPKNPDGSYARKFIDIMRDDVPAEDSDPGELDCLSGGQQDWIKDKTGAKVEAANKFDGVVRDLIRYISEKNWPLSKGMSFKDKYYPDTPDSDIRLAQIVVNIIDYVRAKESKKDFIAPLRFALGPDDKYTLHATHAYGTGNNFQGVSRSPYLTELGMWMEKDPTVAPTPMPTGWPKNTNGSPKALYKCYYKAEIYLPANYGIKDGIDLVPDLSPVPAATSMGWMLGITGVSSASTIHYFQGPEGNLINMSGSNDAVRIFRSDVAQGGGDTLTRVMPGRRVVVTKMFYRERSHTQQPKANVRTALIHSTSNKNGLLTVLGRWPRINVCPQTGSIEYTTSNPATTPIGAMLSLETDDPRANSHPTDWKANLDDKNSLGVLNSRSSIGKDPLDVQPQQDTDKDGKITDASLYMPAPKGTGNNDAQHDDGRVTTVGELGYVVTGNDAQTGSTPWRTLRLQPNNYQGTSTLPDWALLDLFSVPNSSNSTLDSMLKPHGTSVGGRVNVNSHVQPFQHLTRDRGLLALVTGAPSLSLPAAEVAANIYHRVLATGQQEGKVYGYPWTPAPAAGDANAYDTPGEICEIKGVADGGEASEDFVREIASLVTTRGGVFSVYTIGQALKQTRNGHLSIIAEQRQQAVIERYLNNRGTLTPVDDEVQFRTIYFRNLTP